MWPQIIFSALTLGETAVALLIEFGPRTLALRDALEAAVDLRLGAGPNALASTRRPDQVTRTHWTQNGQEKSISKYACKVWVVREVVTNFEVAVSFDGRETVLLWIPFSYQQCVEGKNCIINYMFYIYNIRKNCIFLLIRLPKLYYS